MPKTDTPATPAATPDAQPESFRWDDIAGDPVERLRAPKVIPVDASVVKLAQRSYDGVKVGEETRHVLRHRFESPAKAEAFAKLVKAAGLHTTPLTSVQVAIDPDGTGDTRTVAWRAGTRRGRQTTV